MIRSMQSSDETADTTPTPDAADPPQEQSSGRFSPGRLSAAFARLTGTDTAAQDSEDSLDPHDESSSIGDPLGTTEAVTPSKIVEGMLFVGAAEGPVHTSRMIAAKIRGVSPSEVDDLVVELNETYQRESTAYQIVSEGAGYRMQLCDRHAAVRERFSGRIREAKLTPSAIEVLSVVAYQQPVTAEQINTLRGSRSQTILSHLVRRGLLNLERPEENPRKPLYRTTGRFNELFAIESPQELPNSEDLNDG